MKKLGTALLLAGGTWALMAQAPSGGNAANGKQIFMKQGCFRCHGTDGQGGAGRRLTPNPLAAPRLSNTCGSHRDRCRLIPIS